MRIQGMNKDISMITRAIERKTREVIQQISPCPSSFLECEDVGLGGTEAGGLPGVGNVARGREIRWGMWMSWWTKWEIYLVKLAADPLTDEVVVVLALLCAAILNPPLVAKIVLWK